MVLRNGGWGSNESVGEELQSPPSKNSSLTFHCVMGTDKTKQYEVELKKQNMVHRNMTNVPKFTFTFQMKNNGEETSNINKHFFK